MARVPRFMVDQEFPVRCTRFSFHSACSTCLEFCFCFCFAVVLLIFRFSFRFQAPSALHPPAPLHAHMPMHTESQSRIESGHSKSEEEKCLLGVFITCHSHKYAFYETSDICGCVCVCVCVYGYAANRTFNASNWACCNCSLTNWTDAVRPSLMTATTHTRTHTQIGRRVCVSANLRCLCPTA